MSDPLLALPQFASPALTTEPAAPDVPDQSNVAAPVVLDFAATELLSDDELRVIALESSDSRAKLAACWRMMIRGQAIPQVEPTEGVRGLTLLNLATVQNIEILGVVLELDPSATVRARAAVLMWRVARDRDRVVNLLVTRLRQDPSETVIVTLLNLEPALPFELISRVVADLMLHTSPAVRSAAWSFGLDHGGQIDTGLLRTLSAEQYRGVRETLLYRWAYSSRYHALIGAIAALPQAAGVILEYLYEAGREFSLSDLEPMISQRIAARERAARRGSPWPTTRDVFENDGDFLDRVLKISLSPCSVDERRKLVGITGRVPTSSLLRSSPSKSHRATLTQPETSRLEWWTSTELLRRLEVSYTSENAFPLDADELSWVAILRQTIASPDVDDSSDDDMPQEDNALRQLVSWMGCARSEKI